ncbi:TPA: hypothetical protein ACGXQA_004243 [Bacillus mobilis]
MEKYTVDFEFCNGNLSFVVNTNHIFMVENNDKKKEWETFYEGEISRCLSLYYHKETEEILIDIIKNDYFDEAWITEFQYYDERKGGYLNFGGLHPVQNPKCETKVSKEQFIKILKEEYKEYLELHDILTFESIAYGVNPALINTKEMVSKSVIGDRWVNEEGIAVEHTVEGLKWEKTNHLFTNEITKELNGNEAEVMKWIPKMSECRKGLHVMGFPKEKINYWTEKQCEEEFNIAMENSDVLELL